MITTHTTHREGKEFLPVKQRFGMNPPAGNPLAASASVSFSKLENEFLFKWKEHPLELIPIETRVGNLKRAISRSEERVTRNPQSARAHINLGLVFLNINELEHAATHFKSALELKPDHYVAALSLARIRAAQGDLNEADKLYRKILRSRQDDPTLLASRAHILMRKEKFSEAVELLRTAIRLDPKGVLPRFHLGIASLKLQRTREAISHLRAATRLTPRSPELHHALGAAFAIAGLHKKAINSFRIAIALNPYLREAIRGLSTLFITQGENEKAIQLLSDYLDRRPRDTRASELLAWAHARCGHHSAAKFQFMKVFKSLEERGGSAKAQARITNNIGTCFDKLGDKQGAISWYILSKETDPDYSSTPFINLARAYHRSGQLTKAHQALAECKERFPQNQEVRILGAIILNEQGSVDAAIQQLELLLREPNPDPDVYALLGEIYIDEKYNQELAVSILKQGSQKHPMNQILINNLAYALLMAGDLMEARKTLGTLSPESMNDVAPLATQGLLLLLEGDIDQGKKFYQNAQKVATQEGRDWLAHKAKQKMFLEVARAYVGIGERNRAIDHVRRGLAIKKGHRTYRKSLEALSNSLNPPK